AYGNLRKQNPNLPKIYANIEMKFDEETVGTEIRGPRPGIIISDNSYNQISERVIILPCSRTLAPLYSFELFLPQIVKNVDGKVMIDQIQSIDKGRIQGKIRSLRPDEMNKIIDKLQKILPLRELLRAKL
ncbi:4480_t:CDS:2, partial [Racocetra fulgida]